MRKDTKARDFTRGEKMAIAERDSIDGWTCCVFCGAPAPATLAWSNAHYISRAQGGLGIAQNGLTQEGTAVCSYSLAVKRPMTKDATDFLDFVTWRQGAEYLTQYGHKGDIVAVSGALQARDWTDKNGNKRRAFEVVTTSVELLSSKRNSQDTTNTGTAQNAGYGQPSAPQQTTRGNRYSQQGFGGYQEITEDDPALPF